MTIYEQLQFSVLTAPVACLDRRTLSQAWYSALYGSEAKAVSASTSLSALGQGSATAASAHLTAGCAPSLNERTFTARAQTVRTPAHAEGTPQDRRAPRSVLARKIERAFLSARSTSRQASFNIEGERGRVHVLLQSRGARLKLIAICPPKARPHVAAALAQARYALAMRGIDLDADTRTQAQC